MTNYFEAPDYHSKPFNADAKLFLAGGITGCPEWQREATENIHELAGDITILNPRRANFPMDDPSAARAQIEWEHHHLYKANVILFWFPAGAIQPIALYELGYWTAKLKPIVVGTDPAYERRQDVVIQTELARPGLFVFDDLYHTIGAALLRLAEYGGQEE